MKKIASCVLLSLMVGFSGLAVAGHGKCQVQLKLADGTVLNATLTKEDCKKVNSIKKGEKVELCWLGYSGSCTED